MDIQLVTDVDGLEPYVDGWDALTDRVAEPRAAGTIVAAWARHMMAPDLELRVWMAIDGSEVVGVFPLVAEMMPRQRVRLSPPSTDMMYGTVPIAHPDRAREVAEAVADKFAEHSQPVDLVSIFWLPEGSPWTVAFGRRLTEPEWVTTTSARYDSPYTSIGGDGLDAWLGQRSRQFRREAGRRARRYEDQGFRSFTTVDRTEIMERLPRLQSFYVRRQQERGGEGYRFDDEMIKAIETALEVSTPGRFRLSVLENDDMLIGASLTLRAGTRISGWITGYDPAWSRLGPGIAAILEALDAGARAGCEIADFGVGDQPYKEDLQDAAFPLESVTWCRPRLARLLQLASRPMPVTEEVEHDPAAHALGAKA